MFHTPVVYLLESDVLVIESIAEEGLLCHPSERLGEARSAHLLTWTPVHPERLAGRELHKALEFSIENLAPPARLERATPGLGNQAIIVPQPTEIKSFSPIRVPGRFRLSSTLFVSASTLFATTMERTQPLEGRRLRRS